MLNNISVNTFANKNGRAPLNTEPTPSPEIAEATFIQVPTGGVTAPTAKPDIRIAPKWMGEMPTATHAGKKTGVNNKIAGLTSMKVPAINMIKTIKINIMAGERLRAITKPATFSGILSSASIQM